MKGNVLKKCVKVMPLLVLLATVSLLMPLSLQAAGKEASLEILSDDTFQQHNNGRIWKMERSRKLRTSEDVQQYLADLNQGEFSDWRLPTQQGLYDLFAIFDLKLSGDVKIRLEGSYWLADKKEGMHVGAWEIGDQCGPSRSYYSGKAGYVRAVRP